LEDELPTGAGKADDEMVAALSEARLEGQGDFVSSSDETAALSVSTPN